MTVAVGLVAVLAVSGVVEAFVTPSPLPTWARIGVGVVVLAAFLAYAGVRDGVPCWRVRPATCGPSWSGTPLAVAG